MNPTPPTVRCRFCRSDAGELVLDLGRQPACEYFPPLDDHGVDAEFPLRLWLCAGCGLAQLPDDAELPDQPEGVEPDALVAQRRDAVAAVHAAGLLVQGARLVEGATPHGGSWRSELAGVGVHPAADGELADVVVDGSFGLMHATDQAAALERLVARLAPDGTLLFQFHSLAAILRERQWNAVRHGHYAYYSLPTVRRMLAEVGLTVSRAWSFPLYGGTVLVAARRDGEPDSAVDELEAAELADGVLDPVAVRELQDEVATSTAALRELAEVARASGRPLYGYSAASRAVALICLAGLDADLLAGVGDASAAKQGSRMPGTRVPVIPPEELLAARPEQVLLFVPDLLPEVRRALPGIEAAGGRWIPVDLGAV
jgi:C-methyltransferase C-terminal domain/Putative zinc binding domain